MPLKPQQDLFNECYDGRAQSMVSPDEFQKMLCSHCRQPACRRAKWGRMTFDIRAQTWYERLFGEDRKISDLTDSQHLRINRNDFPDASHKERRMILAAVRNDWEHIPHDDGVVLDQESTSLVDRAVEKLASIKGKKPPGVSEDDEDSDDVGLSEADLRRARVLEAEAGLDTRPPITRVQKPAEKIPAGRLLNTPIPAQGVMVGGAKEVKEEKTEDPWAPKKRERVVKPGSSIRLGKDGDDE